MRIWTAARTPRERQDKLGILGRGTSSNEGARQGQDGEASAVLAKIAGMLEPDRAVSERLHAVIKTGAPDLSPKTWYGIPPYAKNGKKELTAAEEERIEALVKKVVS